MNRFVKNAFFISAASTFLLTGCAHYRASDLTSPDPQYIKTYSELPDIEIGCKAFSKDDCRDYLGRDILAQGYQPILLTFYNKTDHYYLFSTGGMSLTCVSPKQVANTVHTSTATRVIGYGIGSIFIPILIIPAIVDGICSSHSNTALDRDFASKGKQDFIIDPKSFRKTVVFIRNRDFHSVFDLTLVERETGVRKTVGIEVMR